MFAHHGLSAGRKYNVTGRLDIAFDDRMKVVAILITSLPEPQEPKSPDSEGPPEIPISSVYYERVDGDIVTVAGSIIRLIGETDFLLQDDTGTIVVEAAEQKFRAMDLSVGKFLIVTGTVQVLSEEGRQIDASRLLVRKRQTE